MCLCAGARPAFDLVTPSERARVALDLIGEHHAANALAAAAAAAALGLPTDEIAAGLNAATLRTPGRFEITNRPDGVTVINDAYNANPESMRAGLHALTALAGDRRTIAVLGAMGQQADASRAGAAVYPVEDVAGAVRVTTALIAPGDVVFVKASSEYGLDACAR